MYDYFSEADCIRLRVTVNNEGSMDSRLHWEVVVFILTYSQHAFFYSPFTLSKYQTFSSRERNTQIIYKLTFRHPDFVYNVWLYFIEASNIRLWQSYSKQTQRFYWRSIYRWLQTSLRGLSLCIDTQSASICTSINVADKK